MNKILIAIIGVLVVLVGLGTGVYLVRQQQVLKEKAAGSACLLCQSGTCAYNGSVDQNSCDTSANQCNTVGAACSTCGTGLNCSGYQITGATQCFNGTNPVYCCPSGQIIQNGSCVSSSGTGGTTINPTPTPTGSPSTGGTSCDGTCSDYCAGADQCASQGGHDVGRGCSIGACSGSAIHCFIPAACSGSGGGGGTAVNINSPNACGETCNSDSDCYPTGANGATERCIAGVCQNTSCVGKTIPGRNCDCSNLNACGQRCGATIGLCQAGSQCGYILGGTQCAPLGTEGDKNNTYCIPTSPTNGYTTGQCTGIATIYLKTPSGDVVNSQSDLFIACGPQLVAQCNAIKAYDVNWNLLTSTQLSNLKSGDKVRFTIMGTTTSGVFDKARFTVNGIGSPEVSGQKSGSVGEYYYEYTIPAGVTSFSVTGQVHLSTNNTWY